MKQGNQNKPRRTFAPEHKLDIVKEANANKASVSTIARKYDVNANQLFRWMREVEHNKMRWVRIATGSNTYPSHFIMLNFPHPPKQLISVHIVFAGNGRN